jgi:hypothetical protein
MKKFENKKNNIEERIETIILNLFSIRLVT